MLKETAAKTEPKKAVAIDGGATSHVDAIWSNDTMDDFDDQSSDNRDVSSLETENKVVTAEKGKGKDAKKVETKAEGDADEAEVETDAEEDKEDGEGSSSDDDEDAETPESDSDKEGAEKDGKEKKEEEEKEEPEAVLKLHKAKLADKEYEIPEEAVFKFKVDGKMKDVTLKDMKTDYSGKVAWDRKFQDLSTEKKTYEADKSEVMHLLKGFYDKTQAKDYMGALGILAQAGGLNPVEFLKKL